MKKSGYRRRSGRGSSRNPRGAREGEGLGKLLVLPLVLELEQRLLMMVIMEAATAAVSSADLLALDLKALMV